MKINKVKLYNFSSYEGNNEFDFEITDAEKNIVLIGGKNGAGKTSLFTPYARIDANHRREISEKFFPNISDQVIILSTDEEINEEYYKIIKPYISKEYLLINDENENRTTIENNYFFEV